MDLTDFLKYPEYFPIFMIWASGYTFIYSLLGKSRVWKDFDSTMKFVSALIMGFAIEFGLVLPFFYLNINNMQVGLLFPAFEKTWIYHWVLTAFVSTLFIFTKNRDFLLKAIRFIFSPILSWLFMILCCCSLIWVIEYVKLYPEYIIKVSATILSYFVFNMIFSIFGFMFCEHFPIYIQRAYEEELVYGAKAYIFVPSSISDLERKKFLFEVRLKTAFLRFSESKRRFVVLALILTIVASIIPLDVYSNTFTPRVDYYANADVALETVCYLFLNAECIGYNKSPYVKVRYLQTGYDIYRVASGHYDILNTVLIPIKPKHAGKSINIGHYYDISPTWNELRVIVPYSLKDNLTIDIVPSTGDADGLQIRYEKIKGNRFNITFIYWKETTIENVNIKPLKLEGLDFNETYDIWIQEFQITNNSAKDIFLCELRYDRLNFQEVKIETLNVTWNGRRIDTPLSVIHDLIKLPIFKIAQGETVTLGIRFFSTNKFPRTVVS